MPGVGISLADALYEKGFFSAEELSNASIEDLIQIRDITEEKAAELIETAKNYVESSDEIDKTEDLSDDLTETDDLSETDNI